MTSVIGVLHITLLSQYIPKIIMTWKISFYVMVTARCRCCLLMVIVTALCLPCLPKVSGL